MLTDAQKYRKKWWAANKKRIREEVRTQFKYRYNALRLRCKREGRKFKISFRTYISKLKKGCDYCGASILQEIGGGVDRKNNLLTDYIAKNLIGCCKNCNKIKSDRLTWKEMKVAMAAVVEYRKGNKK